MKKKYASIFFALLILVGGVASIFVYDFYINPKVNTVPVVVASSDIGFKESLNEDSLEIVNVKKDHVVDGALEAHELSSLKGKMAAININQGTQIYQSLIDTYNLIPDESKGEFIAPVPNEWLFAVPGSLRSSYIADFYAVPDEDQQMLKQVIDEQQSTESDDGPLKVEEGKSANVEKLISNGPILKDVRVASVKDSSNSEVGNLEGGNDGRTSGVISNIEIIADNKMLEKIRKHTQQGYKIYVVYKYER